MSSPNEQWPRNNPSSQSIPLQDLSRPPDVAGGGLPWSRRRSERGGGGRPLLGARSRTPTKADTESARYEGLRNARGGSENNNGRLGVPHIQTPRNTHQPGSQFDEGELSPVNIGDFQSASIGLSFNYGEDEPSPTDMRHAGLGEGQEDFAAPYSTAPEQHGGEGEEEFSTNDDRLPLTDSRFLSPISGSRLPPAPGQNHDRRNRSGSSATFFGRMLGDDLGVAENGLGPSRSLHSQSGSRSLSISATPFNTASDMLRKMSQRIVNLSNEPEPVEQELQRPESGRGATLDAPPSFPAMTEYAHDEPPSATSTPPEKNQASISIRQKWQQETNPLRGRSLGIFPPNNPLRRRLMEMLVHPITEPLILVLIFLQTVVLSIDAAPNLFYGDTRLGWSQTAWGWVLVALFVIYTLEIAAKVVVSGFMKNAHEYSTRPELSVWQAIRSNLSFLFGSPRVMTSRKAGPGAQPEFQPSIIRSFTAIQEQQDPSGHGRQAQRYRLARRAFLRHSFNRIDLVAVVSFWIALILSITGIGLQKHIYVFQMLSCSRILRLLNLTSGTSVILRSLKKAAPLLVHVGFLIGFFWLLFAIVGIQSFKSSLGRTCVFLYNETAVGQFVNPDTPFELKQNLINNGYNLNDAANGPVQFCGGSFAPDGGSALPYYDSNFAVGGSPKGFWCAEGSVCVEGMNIYNNSVSFDNIGNSLELVFVVMSSNTFSDILYFTTDSDSLAGSIFFILGIVIMSFWLMNLLVAVITSNFQVIREESRGSAFASDDTKVSLEPEELPKKKRTPLKRLFDKTYWLWIIIITLDLIIMALKTSSSSQQTINTINITETIVTLILLLEIVLRFLVDWRHFHRSKRNWADLVLAVATTVIQIPFIHGSGQIYNALTVFQILRVYRVVYAVPLVRDLMIIVLGNVSGIFNLIIFVILVTYLSAIFAVQLLRGELPQWGSDQVFIRVTFANIFNSFLGMYQILSSENWTAVMYAATSFEESWTTSWISASFFVLWFIFANFIILNMFIAVIQENFDVSEDEKRLYQVKAFLQQKELTGSTHSNLSLTAIFRFGRESKKRQDPIDFGPATIEMFKDTVVRDFLDEQMEQMEDPNDNGDTGSVILADGLRVSPLLHIWSKLKDWMWRGDPNPFYSDLFFSRPYEELDPRTMAKEIITAADQRKRAQRQYLVRHPKYNVSLFFFTTSSPLRRFCQTLVGPGRGSKRFEGLDPIKIRWYTFSFVIYACIVAMVLLACIATPLYQRDFFNANGGFEIRNWFVWTDLAFAAVFTIEALIKIIADGFFWTPNAYFRGTWGLIDGVVLITLWISVAAALTNYQDVARTVGAFKALRALRLLNVSDNARDTFHSVIVMSGWKLLSAAFVSLSLLVPFAIYGVNLFSGRLLQCNDYLTIDFIANPSLTQCIDEYAATPFNWAVLSPRTVQNEYFAFDSFGDSLFILFQIVSQEGWIDVMWAAISARAIGQQPIQGFNPANGIFFVVFNLLSAVFVLTLFVSIFMRSYTEQTGVAYLTAEQRSWLELRKLLRQISPSKRPSNQPQHKWKNWCYRTAVNKHGTWQRMITFVLVTHAVLLASESFPGNQYWDLIANVLFTFFVALYIANIVIRIIGLTWKRFRRSSWDLYSLFAVGGTVILTILNFAEDSNQSTVRQLQKLFLVSIALLLIPRNNQLDQLFKTAAASFSAIFSLILTWLVIFLVFAIALTQTLGLTRFGSLEQTNLNFRTVIKALILLFRMSCGEGWNQIMMDFSNAYAPLCIEGDSFFNSDCGSVGWSRALFVAWNIISMYIFVSMFVSLIFESFSYVYQQSSGMSVLTREEIRRFKQAWATFDPNGTGFISRESFPRLLGELSGVFAMRIYDGEHSVRQIMEDCQADPRAPANDSNVIAGLDLKKLNQKLATIDVADIRRRRARLNIFSQEILVSADPERGVSFLSCLLILAHYNVISDSKSLRLEEFLRRRYRLQRVEEEVQRRIVIGFFDTLYWSRAFRRRQDSRHSARMVDIPQFAVPEIYIDDQDGPGSGTGAQLPTQSRPSNPFEPTAASPVDTGRDPFSPDTGALVSPSTPDGQLRRSWTTINKSAVRGPDEPAPLFGGQRTFAERAAAAGREAPALPEQQPYGFGGDSAQDLDHSQDISMFSPSTVDSNFSPRAEGMSSFPQPPGSNAATSSDTRFGGGFGVSSPGGPSFDGFEPLAFDGDALVSPDETRRQPPSPQREPSFEARTEQSGESRRTHSARHSDISDSNSRSPIEIVVPRREVSGSVSPRRQPSEYVSPRRDEHGMLSPDVPHGPHHQRQQSSVSSQRTMAIEAFDNSAWGESIRRSFTTRRPPTRGSRGRSPEN